MKIQMISIFIISLIFFGCGLSDSEKLQQPGLKENKALSILENSNQLTKDDLTLALISAIRSENSNIQLIKRLIEMSADINAVSKHNMSPLMLSVLAHKKETIQLLLQQGADLDRFETFEGMNALMLAVDMENIEIVKMLIASGANPYSISPVKGISALDLAQSKGLDEIYNMLKP